MHKLLIVLQYAQFLGILLGTSLQSQLIKGNIMQAIANFLNRAKTVRAANRYIKENTKAKSFKDTDHGRKVYDTFKDHEADCESNTSIIVACGVSYDGQKLFFIEGLQCGQDEMSIFVNGLLYFHGTQLGFEKKGVIEVTQQLLEQLGVSLGHYSTEPAKFN